MSSEILIEKINLFFPVKLRPEYVAMVQAKDALLGRAADALEVSSPLIGAEEDTDKLIAKLREAAR